ncbi:hypothetical protein [Rossellomorea marisflavi]|uniref:hypothetical protein n=1 Tax=Rossellomorea marisflavi TaxID=189381 RepID=UPI00207959EA|nr:hypothetical protein [Rossellomorea marisflavi]USK90441.1 hypothetical protein LIT29_12720 [Rossellomorea marisflavi]
MILVWLLLILYTIFLAPGSGRDVIFHALIRGEFSNVEPLVVTIFSLLGVFPLLFASILLQDRRSGAWPFVLLSMGTGAFSLLPYFHLRGRFKEIEKIVTPVWLMRVTSSRSFIGIIVALFILSLLPLTGGISLNAYGDAFMQSSLVSVMTVDFLILVPLSWYAMKRFRGISSPVAFIPIIGPAVLLWKQRGKKDDERT